MNSGTWDVIKKVRARRLGHCLGWLRYLVYKVALGDDLAFGGFRRGWARYYLV